jgi:hypothetical protein
MDVLPRVWKNTLEQFPREVVATPVDAEIDLKQVFRSAEVSAKAENSRNNTNNRHGMNEGTQVSSSASLFGLPSPSAAGTSGGFGSPTTNSGKDSSKSTNLLSSLFGTFDESDVPTAEKDALDPIPAPSREDGSTSATNTSKAAITLNVPFSGNYVSNTKNQDSANRSSGRSTTLIC